MNKYKAKTLILSYKINIDDGKYYVMVPEKKLNHTCMVVHDSLYMIIDKGAKPVTRYYQAGKTDAQGKKIAPDFWGCYFLWSPYKTKKKKEEIRILDNLVNSLSLDKIRELKDIALGIKKV